MKKKLTNTLKIYRFMNDEMSQEELGRAVGLSRSSISMLENGKRLPTLIQAYRLSKQLNTTIEELFFGKERLFSS
ncbi:hypothetical protein CHISP_3767 [Chitinispirillum alkaliphilum]|nr:hypothetical protein CHISP_3767 [Chitinispirillum alkaliphilum]